MKSELLNKLFSYISWFGLPIFYIPIVIFLWSIEPLISIKLFLSLITIEIVCGIIKLIYQKERPKPLPKLTFHQRYEAGSFPSIHSARMVSIFIALTIISNNILSILAGIFITLAVGYSRMYLKKHDLIDVIGGFLIGMLITIYFLINNHDVERLLRIVKI